MAARRAAKQRGMVPPAAETRTPDPPLPDPGDREEIVRLSRETVERHLTALRSESAAVQRQLDVIRSELQTAVLADVMALVAETAAPEQTELQRRARAIQVELTLRRQEVALAEWRRKLEAAGVEADRQRRLFARLEADFERRVAGQAAELERVSAELARLTADFAALSADFARAVEAADQSEGVLRTGLAERESALRVCTGERDAALAELRASLEAHAALEMQSVLDARTAAEAYSALAAGAAHEARVAAEAQARSEAELRRAFEARAALEADAAAQAHAGLEARLGEATEARDAVGALAETRWQAILVLEQALARARFDNTALGEELATVRAKLAERETVLTEAERRVEELRSSRWRRLGLGLRVAKRATFEK
jgi:hypothetical protein